jgi:hypothetical protein
MTRSRRRIFMLRILRWMVLGLLLMAPLTPAVQARAGGIDSVIPASGPDLDPDGTPAASMVVLALPSVPAVGSEQGESGEAAVRGERLAAREGDAPVAVEWVAEVRSEWFLR